MISFNALSKQYDLFIQSFIFVASDDEIWQAKSGKYGYPQMGWPRNHGLFTTTAHFNYPQVYNQFLFFFFLQKKINIDSIAYKYLRSISLLDISVVELSS